MREKLYDHINHLTKFKYQKYQNFHYDKKKNSQKNNNKRELPQLNKEERLLKTYTHS